MEIPQSFDRLRRLRQSEAMRSMFQETELKVQDFIYPLFIKEGLDDKQAINSMPGQFQLPLHMLAKEAKEIADLGIKSVILFGVPSTKDALGSDGFDKDGIIARSIREIKQAVPELIVISDLCCCEYTHHGHCGYVDEACAVKDVDNDKTLSLLMDQAITHAVAGVDMVAPSGMMDGAVKAVRQALDMEGFGHVPIMGYSVKYASCLYGPFREAAEGAPSFGDRKTYQMNIANSDEALREAKADIDEGVDILMVKPASVYLDVIAKIKQHYPQMPMAAYHVSGEYAMIKAAAEKGWLDETKTAYEVLLGIKRAGADLIINYFAKDLAKVMQA